MAYYLGFATIVDNAYDASQIASMDQPVAVGAVVTGIALHVGNFEELGQDFELAGGQSGTGHGRTEQRLDRFARAGGCPDAQAQIEKETLHPGKHGGG
jgi:hypothetical protein